MPETFTSPPTVYVVVLKHPSGYTDVEVFKSRDRALSWVKEVKTFNPDMGFQLFTNLVFDDA